MGASAWLAAIALTASTGVAHAQVQSPFPTRPIRIIASSAPGGAIDTITRVVTAKLGDALGQPVIAENRNGANGAIAAELTAHAQADGHMLMVGGNGNLAINPLVNKKLGYHPLKDLAPITSAALGGHIMVVHPSLPVHTVKEFIALAKARPGQLSYGTAGFGSSQHLTTALLQRMTQISLLLVPYKGGAPATAELVAGQTQLGFPSTATALNFVNQGRLRALAVTTKLRLKAVPQLPTLMEAGVPDFSAYT